MSIKLGDQPIDFELEGTDGSTYSLQNFEDSKFLAVVFSCNHCPYVVASEREFISIQKQYGEIGFQMVAINPNALNPNYPADSPENMRKRASEKQFNFPYLVDGSQEVARAYGAGRTPEIFLFNEERKLVYHGRINDNPRNPNKVQRHDLQHALDELVAGKEISVPQLPAIGCSIKYFD